MAMGGFWFPHYFVQILPPLSVLAGMSVPHLPAGRARRIWMVPIALAVVLFTRDLILWTDTPERLSRRVFWRDSFVFAPQVANYLSAETRAEDPVFVAFDDPEIYFLARRKASFPHMYLADFVHSDLLFQRAIASLSEGVPVMVVVVQDPPPNRMSRDDFEDLLSRRYEVVHTIIRFPDDPRPIVIYRRMSEDGREE
jgi:hypothetical protein